MASNSGLFMVVTFPRSWLPARARCDVNNRRAIASIGACPAPPPSYSCFRDSRTPKGGHGGHRSHSSGHARSGRAHGGGAPRGSYAPPFENATLDPDAPTPQASPALNCEIAGCTPPRIWIPQRDPVEHAD
jgi:hypothetical protein